MKKLLITSLCVLAGLTQAQNFPTQITLGTNQVNVLYTSKLVANAPVTAYLQNSQGRQGTALFISSGTNCFGTIFTYTGTQYSYRLIGNTNRVLQLPKPPEEKSTNTADFIFAKPGVKAAGFSGDTSVMLTSNGAVVVDILACYTPNVLAAAGSVTNVYQTIQLSVAEANQAYANSQIGVYLNLVGVVSVGMAESSSLGVDLGTFSTRGDVLALREQYSADVVTLFEQSQDPYYSGMAYQITTTNTDSAFNVVGIQYAVGYYVLAHEVGHNFGCAHDIANAASPGFFPSYSYGNRFVTAGNTYRTVMAYPPGFVCGLFSSTNLLFLGTVTGNSSADNVDTMNYRAAAVAAFRSTPIYQVTIAVNGTGSVNYQGGVAPSTLSVPRGTILNLSAVGKFLCWSGSIFFSSSNLTVQVQTNLQISANFSDATQPFKPVVIQDPTGQNVLSNASVTLSCQAVGIPLPQYYWKLNGTAVGTGSNYVISSASKANQGYYTCTASNSQGTATSGQAALTVGNPARILQQPVDTLAVLGGSATFSVILDTTGYTYQWYFNSTPISQATNSTLTLANIQNSNMGLFSVKAAFGGNSLISSNATLYLSASPQVVYQPTNQAVTLGQSAQFSVAAVGLAPLTYQWFVNGRALAGQTSAILNLSNVQTNTAGTFYVQISNPQGITTSASAWLTVYNPLAITQQPAALLAPKGSTPIFSITAGGSDPITYQWFYQGAALTNQVYSTCRLLNVQTNQTGTYYVIVSNPSGSLQSSNTTLTVSDPPIITTQPQAITVDQGSTGSLTVTATGRLPLSYYWYKNNVLLTNGAATLTFNPVFPAAAGYYYVVVSNLWSTVASAAVAVNVNTAPSISMAPQNTTAAVGNAATFNVSATGVAPLSYFWTYKGTLFSTNPVLALTALTTNLAGTYSVMVSNRLGAASATASLTVLFPPTVSYPLVYNIDAGNTLSINPVVQGRAPITYRWVYNGVTMPGQTGQALSLNNMQSTNAGSYSMVASNPDGTTTGPAASVSVFSPPTIITQPVSVTNNQGVSVSFTVGCSGGVPLSYQWLYNGALITGATNYVLTLNPSSPGNEGSYQVIISNRLGSVSSVAAKLVVRQPPTITQNPASFILPAGSSTNLSVAAGGRTPYGYQWKFNNLTLAGQTNAILSLSNLTTNQSGNYSVYITNSDGAILSSQASSLIVTTPSIISNPANTSVNKGQPATFNVSATSQVTPSFQWFFLGQPIVAGISARLTVTNANLTQAGAYQVVVGNMAGSVTSTVAYLAVKDPPVVGLASTSFGYLGTIQMTPLVVTSVNPVYYQWYFAGALLSAQTNSSLYIAGATKANAGNYTVQVSNSDGTNAAIAAANYIVNPPSLVTNLPANISCIPGVTLSMSVAATGANPLSYAWWVNGTNAGYPSTNVFTLATVQTNDGGSYQVVITNVDGSLNSSKCMLTVIAQAPVISQQPATLVVGQGGSGSFTISCSNPAGVTYQWYKNGAVLANAVNPVLTLNNIQNADVASYTVGLSNLIGVTLSSPAGIQLTYPPVITSQPQSTVVTAGSMAGFSVSATGTNPNYQWLYNGTPVGNNSASYFVASASVANAGSYQVSVYNSAGTNLSAVAQLILANPPSITQQPVGMTNQAGSTLSLSVGATGRAPLAYQWFYNNTAVAGQTLSTLVYPNVGTGASGYYQVKVTNPDGQASSASVQVLITNYVSPTANFPVIVQGPVSQTIKLGGSTLFTVNATNANTYQWQFNGAAISGANQSTYAITNAIGAMQGFYSVAVSNSYGGVLSASAGLTVLNPPVITSQPLSQTVTQGATVTYTVQASGGVPLHYQWYQLYFGPVAGATNNSLVLSNVASTVPVYYAFIWNTYGSVSSSNVITTVLTQPYSTFATTSISPAQGGSANLAANIGGTQPMSYQWYFNGNAVPGATNYYYLVAQLQAGVNDGTYAVAATNQVGGIFQNVTVMHVKYPPLLSAFPVAQNVSLGSTQVLSVLALGRLPMQYQWYYNGTAVPGATNAAYEIDGFQTSNAGSYYVMVQNQDGMANTPQAYYNAIVPPRFSLQPLSGNIPNGGTINLFFTYISLVPITTQWYQDGIILPGGTNTSLIITNVQQSSAGTYVAVIQNSAGYTSSIPATISITYPPKIVENPQGQVVGQGSTLNLEVSATGTQPMGYVWYLNNVQIVGPNSRVLSLQNIQTNQSGNYTACVTNAFGIAWSTGAAIKVLPLPIISQAPQVTIVTVSNSFTLSVTAAGIGPFTYQWLKDEVAIPGATLSNYTNISAQFPDQGLYSVVVGNAYGTVETLPVIVLVLPTQPLLLPTNPSWPILLQVAMNSDNSASVVYYGAVSSNYVIQASIDLNTWSTINTNRASHNLNFFKDNSATNLTSRFYQVLPAP